MEKRNKLWRKRHQWRLFKAKMVLFANYPYPHFIDDEGNCIQHPHWFDLAKQRWNYHYRSMRTPCSCCLCRRENIAIVNKKPRTGYMRGLLYRFRPSCSICFNLLIVS